jgi:chromate transporter
MVLTLQLTTKRDGRISRFEFLVWTADRQAVKGLDVPSLLRSGDIEEGVMDVKNKLEAPAPQVSLSALYRVFFWIGAFSFGGGLTPWMYREVVEVRGWMAKEQFLSGVAVSQVLPGVNSTNMAIFIGQRLRGAVGAATTLIGMLTVPFVFVLTAAVMYDTLLAVPGVAVALVGVAAAATGMLLRMGLVTSRVGLRNMSSAAVMVTTFVLVGVLRWPVIPVLAVIVPLSVAAAWPRNKIDA